MCYCRSMDVVTLFQISWVAVLFLLGSAIGSFLLVVADRYMVGEGFLRGRSKCDACGHQLYWVDLIPYVSYVVSRGKCRYCNASLSLSYPLFEFAAGALCVALIVPVVYGGGSLMSAIIGYAIACILLILVRIDVVHMVLPDMFLLGVAGLVVAKIAMGHVSYDSIALGILVGAGFLYSLWSATGGAGIGFGDVKLMVPLGALFGLQGTITLLFVAFFIGGLLGIVLLALRKVHKKTAVPFGPFLIIAAYILMLYPSISDRFFQLIGVQ